MSLDVPSPDLPSPHSPEGQPLTLDQALTNIRQTTDTGLRYYAAWWLGRMRVRGNAAVNALIEALQDEADRSPDGGYPLRRNAAKALGKLGNQAAVPDLIECLACPDYYVRESAAQALEELGNEQAIAPLVDLLAGGVEAAVPVPEKPHLVQPYNAVLEALGTLAAGNTALVELVEPFLAHPVPNVQNAAARALYQFTGAATYADRLVQVLQHDQLQLRRAALMDLGAIGYVPAADAIAATLAENSMKLMSLNGILEWQLAQEPDRHTPSDTTQHLLRLMDSLL
ncbi:MAG: HEAT repeat domain-containing protein [Cyanobacteria bacterium P01_A01_bin.105]